ncbi:MAG: glycosyl hydrolase [Thermoanaerobaculia bacterium]
MSDRKRPRSRSVHPIALTLLLLAAPTLAAGDGDADPFAGLALRNIGPVNMSGRVTDIEGIPGDPDVVYVGAASGGVWKTTDGGLTFAPVFDEQPIASIGDIALAPSNPDVVYVGTGEANPRNSVSFGDGVYKSTDGGRSWRHVGLGDTRHVTKILVHPTDPDLVYVAALGHVFGPNEERGVFRSRDGGASWQKVLYLDDRHGASDLAMDPHNPNILFAGLWAFDRKPWTHTSGSEEGGLWRSVDGGDTWEEIEEGIPELTGRIGVEVSRSNPDVVYVIAETHEGIVFRSSDRGETFEKVNDEKEVVSRGLYYTHIRVDPADENRVYSVASRLWLSTDGGREFERISPSTHVDFHALWIDPTNPNRLWQGQDGGVAVSYDRGRTWEPIRNLPIAQFYQVYADDREPFYYLGGGLQDNGTWYGPSATREPAGILEDDWRMMSFGDAYYVVSHPDDPEVFLSEYQGGGIVRTDMTTRRQVDVSPQPRRNDGGPVGELPYRFNWNAPIIQSPNDPYTVYFCGNVVFRTRDFGDSWDVISPDLTTDDPEKQKDAGGPAFIENTTAEYHTTIISFAESAAEAGVLWAGTDDGNLQISRDGGGSWTNVIEHVPGVPAASPVSHVEPSRQDGGTAWVAFDRHMFDDFRPHLFVTHDYGATFRRVPTEGIPETAWVWVLRQDPRNPDLLWAGTELGLYASWDRGESWRRAHGDNLPTVAIHDLIVHPRENDLILGTHGRALWILDDATPLQLWSPEVAAEPAHLFPVRTATRFPSQFTRYGLGDKEFKAPNPETGALITYSLAESLDAEPDSEGADEADRPEEGDAEPRLEVVVLDASGTVVRTLEDLPTEKGFHRVSWDLTMDPPFQRKEPEESFLGFGGPVGPAVLPGTYTVRLSLDGTASEQPVTVRVDPTVDVDEEALRRQQEAALELRDMIDAVNHGLRALDVLDSQLTARRETAELLEIEIPAGVEEAWKAFDERSDAIESGLAREENQPFWSQSPRLVDHLEELFAAVDNQFQAPTGAQSALLAALRSELAEAMDGLDDLLTGGVPELNAKLSEAGIPPVGIPAPIARP